MQNFYSYTKEIFLLLSLIAFSYSAHSQSITWSGAGDGTTWSDGNNWNGGVEPGPGQNAVFQDVDATVTFTTSPTVDILDIRADRNVTLVLGSETLNIGAPNKSNIVKINTNSTLAIASGIVNVTSDINRDAIQFRGVSGLFDIEIGTTINITGRKGITSKSDATNGEINNSGEINIVQVANNDGISLNANTQLTLVNEFCAVINLGASKIKGFTSSAPWTTITNNGLITYTGSGAGGGVTVNNSNEAINNGFYDYPNGANFATGNNGNLGIVVDNGVDVNEIVDADGSCIIDITSATEGMIAYNWNSGSANGADGTLDISAAGLPTSGGTISVTGCSGSFNVSISVINITDSDCDGVPTSEDCDDNDPNNTNLPTSEDCDDNDANNTNSF